MYGHRPLKAIIKYVDLVRASVRNLHTEELGEIMLFMEDCEPLIQLTSLIESAITVLIGILLTL